MFTIGGAPILARQMLLWSFGFQSSVTRFLACIVTYVYFRLMFYSQQMPRISRISPTTSWLTRTWAYPFAPSNLVTNLGVKILNALAYPFCIAFCRLWCSLMVSVQSPRHIFCITGIISETLSVTSSGTTITTIWRFRILAANLYPP